MIEPDGIIRVAIGLEYDGSGFAGWQTQAQAPSVQSAVEAALSTVADEPVAVIIAGRTDAGVHAASQVAHFDTTASRSARGWVLGANTHLPPQVSVRWAQVVPRHFHARYSAEARTYRYIILNRLGRSALAAGRVALIYKPLDVGLMTRAAQPLLGEHDFSAFRAAECQARSPVRCLQELSVWREGEQVIIQATANAFLHHMVRNLAGLLIAAGLGKLPPEQAEALLASRDRTLAPPTAPAEGLYFWSVRYPQAFGLPNGPADGHFAGCWYHVLPAQL